MLTVHIYLLDTHVHIICYSKAKRNPGECLVKPLYLVKEKTEAWEVKYMPKVTQLIDMAKLPSSPYRKTQHLHRLVVLTVWAGPAASASPGSLSDMQILGPRSRPTESELLGKGPAILFQQAVLVILMQAQFENHQLRVMLLKFEHA